MYEKICHYHFKFEEKKNSKIPDLDTRALVAKL